MQNAVSVGQVPGIELTHLIQTFFCLSLHAQLEKRLLLVGIDRLSPKPKLSKGESGLSQSSGSFWKMKEIISQEEICPSSRQERWGRSWAVAHHGGSRDGPAQPHERLSPAASRGHSTAGTWPGTDRGGSLFYQASWGQTDSNQLHAKQANEAQSRPKKSTLSEMPIHWDRQH